MAVNTKVLDWALDRSGTSVSELESKLKKIRKWMLGEQQPTLKQLETLAKSTATPLGYFFLDEPPVEEMPIPFFRTLDDEEPVQPSPELLDTIYAMQRRQSWMREYLIQIGHDALPYVGSLKNGGPPEAVAQCMREILGVDEDWASKHASWTEALKFLRESMEDAGIIVVVNGVVGNNTHRKLEVSEFRGFVLVDDYAPLAFVNGSDAKAAQMFTLAHELAHICYGSSAAFDLREVRAADDPTEQRCNRAAAEFLVPAKLMLDHWQEVQDIHKPFDPIARLFKVSEIVVARRALDLGLITKDVFLEFYQEHKKRKVDRKSDGGDFYRTQNMRIGKKFATSVILAVMSDKLLYQEAYRLTGLRGKTFEKYAESLGFVGV